MITIKALKQAAIYADELETKNLNLSLSLVLVPAGLKIKATMNIHYHFYIFPWHELNDVTIQILKLKIDDCVNSATLNKSKERDWSIFKILNKEDYETALEEVEKYFGNEPIPNTIEGIKFQKLLDLIKGYEDQNYPIN